MNRTEEDNAVNKTIEKQSKIVKHCITCHGSGHTYLECPRVPFFSLFQASLGIQPIIGPSKAELIHELEQIEIERENKGLNMRTSCCGLPRGIGQAPCNDCPYTAPPQNQYFPSITTPIGCICPPGANIQCLRVDCPRKAVYPDAK